MHPGLKADIRGLPETCSHGGPFADAVLLPICELSSAQALELTFKTLVPQPWCATAG